MAIFPQFASAERNFHPDAAHVPAFEKRKRPERAVGEEVDPAGATAEPDHSFTLIFGEEHRASDPFSRRSLDERSDIRIAKPDYPTFSANHILISD
jgi:hypothetical protein